jgi:predicted transcriptional regulator
MENKKLTHYSIAKTAGVSYTTVKKYISLDEMK